MTGRESHQKFSLKCPLQPIQFPRARASGAHAGRTQCAPGSFLPGGSQAAVARQRASQGALVSRGDLQHGPLANDGFRGLPSRLIAQAHQRDIKIIIDQVLSHTSDQHQWFIDSREDLSNDKADWYVWADAKEDGTAPNNWLSIFGGGAWQWEPRRGQYYLHNFFTEQPDLNFHNPDVRQAVLDNVEFWLKKGVDGFRLATKMDYCCSPVQSAYIPLLEVSGQSF